MARVVAPFLSVDASGTMDSSITASIWKGQQYMRRWYRPTNPKSTLQTAQRTKMANAVKAYQALYDVTQEAWNVAAREVYPPISGFNYYVQQYINQNITEPNDPTIPAIAPKKARTLHGRGTYGFEEE